MIDVPFDMVAYWPTGSRYICNPPPTDTDNDTVILVENLGTVFKPLSNDEWEFGGSFHVADTWMSWKKTINGVVENLIITDVPEFFSKWKLATEVAKNLNLLDKQDRISCFQIIVEGRDM